MSNLVSIIKDGFVIRTAFGRKIISNVITKLIKKNTVTRGKWRDYGKGECCL